MLNIVFHREQERYSPLTILWLLLLSLSQCALSYSAEEEEEEKEEEEKKKNDHQNEEEENQNRRREGGGGESRKMHVKWKRGKCVISLARARLSRVSLEGTEISTEKFQENWRALN